ncbi:hypothetical protein BDFB_008880 [Asbolus verrucosus]|uniref:Uncharacterized protein n=1 Tax=Asbolus verrucosus TaxID=1661398 RepID=A0A482VKI2_ASBVE|nr:hypothetical protein BDFB_008880 [Asbolus verrucosus]
MKQIYRLGDRPLNRTSQDPSTMEPSAF